MTMEMDLLTNRLADFMKQVAENQMQELINKEKFQNEKLISQDEHTRIVAKSKIDLARQEDRKMKAKEKGISFRDLMGKKNEENKSNIDEKKVQQQRKFGALMGVSSSIRKNLEEKENRAKIARTKFLKAAKMTVFVNSVKQGQVICTCNSLDEKCAKHDS